MPLGQTGSHQGGGLFGNGTAVMEHVGWSYQVQLGVKGVNPLIGAGDFWPYSPSF